MLNYHDKDHGCGTVGKWTAVLCAGLGVVTAYLMISFMNLGWMVPGFPPSSEIAVGLIALFLGAVFLGERAGAYLCGRSDAAGMSVLVGQGVAFGSIAIAVISGTLVAIIKGAGSNGGGSGFTFLDLVLVIYFPMFLVLLFGGIPAVLLGTLYGLVVRNRLRKFDQ